MDDLQICFEVIIKGKIMFHGLLGIQCRLALPRVLKDKNYLKDVDDEKLYLNRVEPSTKPLLEQVFIAPVM